MTESSLVIRDDIVHLISPKVFDGDETNRLLGLDMVQASSMLNLTITNSMFSFANVGKLSGDMEIPKEISLILNEWLLEGVKYGDRDLQ